MTPPNTAGTPLTIALIDGGEQLHLLEDVCVKEGVRIDSITYYARLRDTLVKYCSDKLERKLTEIRLYCGYDGSPAQKAFLSRVHELNYVIKHAEPAEMFLRSNFQRKRPAEGRSVTKNCVTDMCFDLGQLYGHYQCLGQSTGASPETYAQDLTVLVGSGDYAMMSSMRRLTNIGATVKIVYDETSLAPLYCSPEANLADHFFNLEEMVVKLIEEAENKPQSYKPRIVGFSKKKAV